MNKLLHRFLNTLFEFVYNTWLNDIIKKTIWIGLAYISEKILILLFIEINKLAKMYKPQRLFTSSY